MNDQHRTGQAATSHAPNARVVKMMIEEAFHRQASGDARAINVTVVGHRVSLGGAVRSPAHRALARHIVWAIPGVETVIDTMSVVDVPRDGGAR